MATVLSCINKTLVLFIIVLSSSLHAERNSGTATKYFLPADQKSTDNHRYPRQSQPPIEIIEGPQDQHVCPGGRALFQCEYTGTNYLPYWEINGVAYSATNLPSRFHYSTEGLVLEPVHSSDHEMTVTCLFVLYDSGAFHRLSSDSARLFSASLDFGTSQADSSCLIDTELDSFIISDQLISELSDNVGLVQDINVQAGCRHFDKAVMLDADQGFLPLTSITSGSVLALIDPRKGELILSTDQTLTVDAGWKLTMVGLPVSVTGSSGSGQQRRSTTPETWRAGYSTGVSHRAIISYSLSEGNVGIDCRNSDCYLENLNFVAAEHHHPGSQLINQAAGILQVTNSSFSSGTDVIRQQGGMLEIIDSEFLINGAAPAISSDRKVRICGSHFDCTGSCSLAVDFHPYTPDCQPITLEHSRYTRFPQSVSIIPTRAEHSFRVPVSIQSSYLDSARLGTGIVLDGSMDLFFQNNTLVNLQTALIFNDGNSIEIKQSDNNLISAETVSYGCPERGVLNYSTPVMAGSGEVDLEGEKKNAAIFSCENTVAGNEENVAVDIEEESETSAGTTLSPVYIFPFLPAALFMALIRY